MIKRARSVLLVSNEPAETEALRSFLASRGFAVHVTTGRGAVHSLAFNTYGLVITDIGRPGIDGVALTRRALELDRRTGVILILHGAAMRELVEALTLGASDYVTMPIVPAELDRKLTALAAADEATELDDSSLVAESEVMKTVISRAARACAVDLPVFLHGELGTGRKTIARAIHRFGPSRAEPFRVLNLKTVPDHLMASELFGTRSADGAEDGDYGLLGAAGRGAVFLENIDAMPSTVQLKLVGALDTGTIHPLGPSLDARLFCSANLDLEPLVAQGIFQSGLHYRLNALRISIPPLRERREDIPALAMHFLRRLGEEGSRAVTTIAPDAMAALCHYRWPGNIRELANVVERAFVLAADVVRLEHLPPAISGMGTSARSNGPSPETSV